MLDVPNQPRSVDNPGGLSVLETVTLRLGLNTAGDTIDGSTTTHDQVIYGFGGDDTLTGGSGNDSIHGGTGDDTIVGAQNDILLDGGADTTADTLQVGANFDDTGNGQIVNIENVTLTAAVTLNLSNQTEGFNITGSSGDDTITGGSGADTITGGAAVDVLTGGTGNDTYAYAAGDAPAGENIVEVASGGTDTIRTTATADLIALTVNGAADLSGTTSLGIEQILIQAGTTATFSGAQLDGNAIAINESAAGTTNLVINVASGATNSFANLSFGSFTGGNAFDIVGDTITINGTAGNETITATTFGDTINAGAGADTVKINAGSLTNRSWTVDVGSDAVQDTVIFNHTALGLTDQTVVTVNNFDVTDSDRIAVTLNGTSITNGFTSIGINGTVSGANIVVELDNSALVASAFGGLGPTDDSNGGTIEDAITAASINSITAGNYTFIVYSNATGTADAGVYTVNISDNTDPGSGGMTVEHVMTLTGVGFGQLGAANFANLTVADPIVLDLGAPGIHFTSSADGVAFDINGDGVADQTAWTTGEDGILAFDVNGNGIIDNGTEIFTPHFAGGSYASGLAALASLDNNADGKIDNADAAFDQLQVWQDLNHDGVSQPEELTSLAAQGITAIDLNAAPSNGEIDGQSLRSEGTFTHADGTSGAFVEVNLETTLGTAPQSIVSGSGADTLTGDTGNDTFVFTAITDSQPGADHFDTINNFTHNSDHIDFAAINGLNTGAQDIAFNSLAVAPGSIAAHTIDIVTVGGNTVIYANSTGSSESLANADMEIHLTGVTNVASSDFILHH